MLHKDYNCNCSVGKEKYWSLVSRGLAPRKTDCCKITANEKSTVSSQRILWEDLLL
jgi:hypothetical protein